MPFISSQIPIILSTYIPHSLRDSSHSYWSYLDTISFYTGHRKIHGSHQLPEGYQFAFVPRNTAVLKLENSITPEISSSYNWIGAVVALVQSSYASFTLYRTRGDQIRRFGYASFGLTVAPYAVMSVLNLFGNLVTPDYPKLYLVESEVMGEAKQREGAKFDYVVGRIVAAEESHTNYEDYRSIYFSGSFEVTKDDPEKILLHPTASLAPSVLSSFGAEQSEALEVTAVPRDDIKYQTIFVPACPRFQQTDGIKVAKFAGDGCLEVVAVIVVNAITIGIIAVLSGFHKGESTLAQRVWTMVWLVFGICGAGVCIFLGLEDDSIPMPLPFTSTFLRRLHQLTAPLISYGAPAVGGFVVVGQMLYEYGSCIRFD